MKRILMLCCAMLGALLMTAHPSAAITDSALWTKIKPLMDKGIEIYTRSDAPESRTMLEHLTFRDPRIQGIIEDCLVVLGESIISDNIAEINRLGEKARKLRGEIEKRKIDFIGLPQSSLNPFRQTRKSAAQAMAKDEARLAGYEAAIAQLKKEAAASLERSGLGITMEELEYLFVAPNGTIISQLMSVAGNVRRLVRYIEKQFGAAGVDNAQAARTYAGLYFIGCRTHVMAYDIAIRDIDEKYRVRLDALRAEAERHLADTRKILRNASESDRAVFEANLETTKSALTVMNEYDRYLKRQKGRLADGRKKAGSRLDLAVNSLRTVNISSQLAGMIRTSIQDMDSLFSFQMPDLNLMYGDIYREEFSRLMGMLKEH